ncbi:MarR family winged helix-turn-helix transcriptional regulator [Microbacterium sp. NPDC055903]
MGTRDARMLEALTHLTTRWSSAGTQAAVAAAAQVEVDPVDIPPLYFLGLEGPVRASELAAALRLSRPTMSKQLTRLERAGFIERNADPEDARAMIITLSAAGAEVHRRLVEQGTIMVAAALEGWDAAEAEAFAAQLTRFVGALSRDPLLSAPGDSTPR